MRRMKLLILSAAEIDHFLPFALFNITIHSFIPAFNLLLHTTLNLCWLRIGGLEYYIQPNPHSQ